MTEDHTFFFFFNGMPVYDLRDIPAFLAHVRMSENPPFYPPLPPGASMSLNNWEYDKYTAMKVLRGEWQFWDINKALYLPQTFRLESLEDFDTFRRIAEVHPPGPLWARASICGRDACACKQLPDEYTPIMLFHLNYEAVLRDCAPSPQL